MDLISELREVAEESDLESFRQELLDAVRERAPDECGIEELDFAFVCEVGARLSDAEEFQDFIPCHGSGAGSRSKKLRVDGYELDEVDDSIRLLIADFKGRDEIDTMTRIRAEAVFAQLKAFVEDSSSGKIWSSSLGESIQTKELSGTIEQRHGVREDGNRLVSRYRFYLITDSVLSDRVKDLPIDELDGVPIERHIWDIGRLKAVSASILGTEELEIDFTKFTDGGFPCLRASQTEDYDGYLCVIQGDALADLYNSYGSRLLEGNVRSFLSATVKINKGIQATIRAEPDRFFVYNNGISATATSAVVEDTVDGPRLMSAKYLQIVNGGQTTASLNVAKRKDKADLSEIYVPMKLSVVRAKDTEMLDEMIQKVARYSNSQTKVNDADFFSNHAFHRAIERNSRKTPAPRAVGATFNTYWFYERARGQYVNAQARMTIKEKKTFLLEHPRSQLINKTDLAKFENSWRKQPHFVSRHAQKNFSLFAEYVEKEYGTDGAKFDNEVYFKEVVAKAILFRFAEWMVSEAKKTWYGGDYRAQIVTYSIAKLVSMIDDQAIGATLNLNSIWLRQGVSPALANQLEDIAKVVSVAITTPPVLNMNVGEWCKKEDCWSKVHGISIPLSLELHTELISKSAVKREHDDAVGQATEDAVINSVVEVFNLGQVGCWKRLDDWSKRYCPLAGREADLVRLASQGRWVPSDKQAAILMKVLDRLEHEGFKRN
ncbi:MAG: AIPR family protein [Candidatus Babeliales bacterium]|jgi:hypothetical protein